MRPDPTPAPIGQHGLGPHVVGQRVVIRRLVPDETGPTGGPAFTDVLGVCERWSGGEAVVRRADGTAVTIATALIVSGKPVPPRGSRFDRLSRHDIDQHLPEPGRPVWLGSISQLARRVVEDAAVRVREESQRVTCELDDLVATAHASGSWVVLERLDDERLIGSVVHWGAERGAATLAITDARVDRLAERLGLVSR